MAMKSSDVAFFQPFWRRAAVTLVIALWFLSEALFTQDPTWLMITGAGTAYAVWTFLIRFPEAKDPPSEPPVAGP